MNILGGVSLTINQESGKLDTQVFAEQMSLIFFTCLITVPGAVMTVVDENDLYIRKEQQFKKRGVSDSAE